MADYHLATFRKVWTSLSDGIGGGKRATNSRVSGFGFRCRLVIRRQKFFPESRQNVTLSVSKLPTVPKYRSKVPNIWAVENPQLHPLTSPPHGPANTQCQPRTSFPTCAPTLLPTLLPQPRILRNPLENPPTATTFQSSPTNSTSPTRTNSAP